MSEEPELIPEMEGSALNPVQPPVTGSHAGAGAPGLVLPAPASVQQFNVFAPQYSFELHVNQVRLEVNELEAYAERRHRQHVATQYSFELHVNQVRLEVNELEAYAERRHRQHVATYEEAAALGLANVEERAERNHLEAVSELQAALANSEFKAATRQKALIAEMSLAQAHSVNEDNRLREELAELEESRYAQNLQEQANQHVQNSQELMLEQFHAHFQIYKDRQREEHAAVVSELGSRTTTTFRIAPLFTMPNVIPQGVRNLFDSMNPGIQCGTQRLLTSYQKKHLSWLALPPAHATGGRHRACPHCGSQHVVGQMVCLGCGAHIVKPSSQKQRKRIKTARWFAEEAASKASGKPRHQLTPEEVMSEMVRDYTTSRGSQSLDGEALDKAKQQLKLAVKRGYSTMLERFDNDVDYTMHSISAGYDREFLAVEDVLTQCALPNQGRSKDQRYLGVGTYGGGVQPQNLRNETIARVLYIHECNPQA
eukprot:s3393_g5.t1